MPVIQRADAATMARDAIVLDLSDIGRQGERMLADAKRRAEEIVREARAERERLVSTAAADGFARGHAEGHAKGLDEGRAQGVLEAREDQAEALRALFAAWTTTLDRFEGERESLLQVLRDDALRLALEIARRVTKRAIEVDPGVAEAQCAAAIALIGRASRAQILANRADTERLRSALPQIAARIGSSAHLDVIEDDSLGCGSCVVRTHSSEIDASIDAQLDRIVSALLPGGDDASEVSPDGAAPEPDLPAEDQTPEAEQ